MKLVAWISSILAALDTVFERSRPPDSHLLPVVLVHGIYSSSQDLARLAGHLRREGRAVFCLDFATCDGACLLEDLAAQLHAFIEEHVPLGPFDLVGFSMGGLVSRYYVQRLAAPSRVVHFVSLAAPHGGTILARLLSRPGVLQMRRGSKFLRDLERDQDCLQAVKVTSFYTPLDLMIVPASSSKLPQAQNIRVWALLHPSLIFEKRCLRAISAALAT